MLVVVQSYDRPEGQLQATGRVVAVLKGEWDAPETRFDVAAAGAIGVTALAFLRQSDAGLVSLENHGLLGSESPLLTVRAAPLAAWPTTGLARTRQLLEATVTTGVGAERVIAAEQLGYLARRPASSDLLARVAADHNAGLALRGACLTSLLRLGEAGAATLAADFIEASRGDHDSQEQRGSMLYELARATPSDRDFDSLVGLASDPDPQVREAAAQALGRTLDPRAIPVLIPLLEDSTRQVRAKTVGALAMLTAKPGRGIRIDYVAKEAEYLDFWRQWWRTEGQPAFAAPAAEARP